jgi:cell division protein FtsQ
MKIMLDTDTTDRRREMGLGAGDSPTIVSDQPGDAYDGAYDGIDPRFEARISEIEIERSHRRGLLMLAVLAVIAMVALVSIVARAAIFDVDHVEVSGANRETVDGILEAARIRDGTAIWSVDLAAVERRIEQLPWVADATVQRHWPNTITITIREYEATAFVRDRSGWVALLGADGRVLELADAAPPGVVEVVGVRRVPEVGGMLFPPGVGALMVELPSPLASAVSAVDVSDGVTLRLVPRGEVRLCDATDLQTKGAIALSLMETVTTFDYIDVCVAAAPTVR